MMSNMTPKVGGNVTTKVLSEAECKAICTQAGANAGTGLK